MFCLLVTFLSGVKKKLLALSKKYYDQQAKIVPPKDIRLAFFGLTGNILHSLLLFSLASMQTINKSSWWEENFGRKEMDDLDYAAIRNLEAFSKHSFLVFFFSRIETLIRKTIRLIDADFKTPPNRPFKQFYDKYFRILSLRKYIPLYDICRLTRNSIHTNGIFKHYKGKDQIFTWNDIEFKFEHDTAINFMTPENIFMFFEDLTNSMNEIVNSEALKKHQFIEDKYY